MLVANADLLTLLHYPDLAAYQAARLAPGFVHADDQQTFDEHIQNGSTATFSARYLRGDGQGYRRLVSQGVTFLLGSERFRLAWVRVG